MISDMSPESEHKVTMERRRLIYFSSVTYASYAQRPHFMAMAFMNGGFDSILWVDPYPTRFPSLADLKRIKLKDAAVITSNVHAHIAVLQPFALPIEPLPLSGWINHMVAWKAMRTQLHEFAREAEYCVLAIGRPSKLAEWALKYLPHQRSFIDVMDYFPAFYQGISRLSMKVRLYAVCRKVTDIYCSSSWLAAMLKTGKNNPIIVRNGYSIDYDLQPVSYGTRRYIGYVGTIGKWFDWPLVRSIALTLPEVTIRLVGPEFVRRPDNLPTNIEFLGERPHAEIAKIISEFVVGLIPFQLNDLTACVDPIKFYEYRSLSIPIWTTEFGEMRSRNGIKGVMHISPRTNWRQLWRRSKVIAYDFAEIAAFQNEVAWSKRFEPILMRSKAASVTLNQPHFLYRIIRKR